METIDFEQLRDDAKIIKNETKAGANTAGRIGEMFLDVIDVINSTYENMIDKPEYSQYPEENQIVYKTIDGEIITPIKKPLSNVYYKELGYGVMVVAKDYNISFNKNPDVERLTYIDLSKLEVTSLESSAFLDCINLTTVILPDTITSIKGSFDGCKNLTHINIPKSVTYIGSYSFRQCNNLISIYLPSKISYIGEYAFYNCYNLLYINIPSNVNKIGDSAFRNCARLRELKISNNIETIPPLSFSYIGNLNYITIGSKVKSVGDDSFEETTARIIDSSSSIVAFPKPKYLETLILRYNGVVKDVDTYLADVIPENPPVAETLDLKGNPIAIGDSEVMPMTNLDTYIGTPNNFLKIYVPSNLLNNYQNTYPKLIRYLHPLTGEDIYTLNSDVVDDLNDSSTNKPLSANKGRVLGEKINELIEKLRPVIGDLDISTL